MPSVVERIAAIRALEGSPAIAQLGAAHVDLADAQLRLGARRDAAASARRAIEPLAGRSDAEAPLKRARALLEQARDHA